MAGGGDYNRASEVQAAGSSPALPLFRTAAERAPLGAPDRPLVIADYGASEGRNSMGPIGAAIGVLRRRAGASREIAVAHTDLPENDFTTLATLLATDPASYLRGATGVFPAMVGRSFYEQILPSGSVTLGWSAWAAQWLSRVPGPIPDQIQVAFSRDAATRKLYATRAAEDWRDFLTHRAAELVPGGRLVVLTMALDDTGDFGYRPLLEAMYATLGELVAEGLVTRAEAAAMAIPTVGRSRADLLAPFGAGGAFAGLRVELAEVFAGEDLIWADFERDGDAQTWARRWTDFSRASVFPTLASRIEGPDAAARRAAFTEALAAGMTRRVSLAPARMNIPLARLLILRE
ncbi:MAG: SAM-dependent methyltransferase [Rhodovulum sulfidophilum]|uniref:SAM-dependent methyltransferase n=1 Tax=Rhodovulum sulfidophilum TaxID=35806 RepID=A0A2W5PZ34_RHOSU|nr:MAG: SAM-dependent methyltransferase [Rhodovulum sulfidophilum]